MSQTRASVAITAGVGLALLLSACSLPFMTPPPLEVMRPPREVVEIAADVFSMYEIPVRRYVPGSNRLESGEFVVERTWGGEAIDARLDCGIGDDGLPRALQGPVRLTVEFTARSRSIQTQGTLTTVDGSSVEIDGRGTLQDGVRCHLTREFARQVLCDVALSAGSMSSCDPARRSGRWMR